MLILIPLILFVIGAGKNAYDKPCKPFIALGFLTAWLGLISIGMSAEKNLTALQRYYMLKSFRTELPDTPLSDECIEMNSIIHEHQKGVDNIFINIWYSHEIAALEYIR